ncbi:hypothetical protein BDK51DRAFT_48028 [Blyttiomyces helicus]|uniref:Uncharacterized protein n=1 Tax=Blyttiomyces helicus TaxID=388810 RepID=A0A4P9W003_9FUNG|nr:hypothetical protein BDK51DRAFT_48028 [Blyttiomyces helicus]|eukprot:RKO85419.1 hypothetical protein BDK51DRAFT_48028 [Blyttiomyces helicus]
MPTTGSTSSTICPASAPANVPAAASPTPAIPLQSLSPANLPPPSPLQAPPLPLLPFFPTPYKPFSSRPPQPYHNISPATPVTPNPDADLFAPYRQRLQLAQNPFPPPNAPWAKGQDPKLINPYSEPARLVDHLNELKKTRDAKGTSPKARQVQNQILQSILYDLQTYCSRGKTSCVKDLFTHFFKDTAMSRSSGETMSKMGFSYHPSHDVHPMKANV